MFDDPEDKKNMPTSFLYKSLESYLGDMNHSLYRIANRLEALVRLQEKQKGPGFLSDLWFSLRVFVWRVRYWFGRKLGVYKRKMRPCGACNGKGVTGEAVGMFEGVEVPCTACRGAGNLLTDPAPPYPGFRRGDRINVEYEEPYDLF